MTLKVWSYGEAGIASADLNNNFNATGQSLLLYTGTDFNTTATNTTQTNTYTTAKIDAADLAGATYLVIRTAITASANAINGAGGSITLLLEEKYDGGAYSTLTNPTLWAASHSGDGSSGGSILVNFEYIYTLTANDLANGIYFKISTTSAATGSASISASATNVQTIIKTGV